MVPAKTQLGRGTRQRRYGSGLETLNGGGCRSETRDDDLDASKV